ncbi:MAG: hypothetical protein ABWX59_13210 [Microbacteriaceae bacterium]
MFQLSGMMTAVHAIAPHMGQGAAQAIEDGVVLVDALSKHDDLESAFVEYHDDRRFERCKLIVDTSLQSASGRWAAWSTSTMSAPPTT